MSDTNKTNLINTNSPRDSRVYAGDDGYVVKKPVDTNPVHIKVWLERQKHAKNTVDRILEKQENDSYFVPKIVEISNQKEPYVREQRVPGQPLTAEYFSALSQQQKDIVYQSLAQFICDMNNVLPAVNTVSQLQSENGKDLSLGGVIQSLNSVLSDKEISTINNAFDFLEKHSEQTPSVVFFHGDMNENNIFFDNKTNVLSIIDFTESKYESAYYMFYSDLSRLSWLDLSKLIKIYNAIPKQHPVRINQDKNMIKIFDCLRTVQRTGNSLLAHPQNKNIYKTILQETVATLNKAYQTAVVSIELMNIASKSR